MPGATDVTPRVFEQPKAACCAGHAVADNLATAEGLLRLAC